MAGWSPNGRKCSASTVSGEQCNARATADGFCPWHSPGRQEQLAESRRRGGAGKANRARARKQLESTAMSPSELRGVIGLSITQVLAGKITPGMAQAVAALARASLAITEAVEIEERLDRLEQASVRRLA
jgi:hypothetical protein